MPIRRKSLQALQQHCQSHESAPDDKRPPPNQAERQRQREIANEMVDLPTEAGSRYAFCGPQGSKYQQEKDGYAANLWRLRNIFCRLAAAH